MHAPAVVAFTVGLLLGASLVYLGNRTPNPMRTHPEKSVMIAQNVTLPIVHLDQERLETILSKLSWLEAKQTDVLVTKLLWLEANQTQAILTKLSSLETKQRPLAEMPKARICPKRIGLRRICKTEEETQQANADAPNRTKDAPAICAKARSWPNLYTREDLEEAETVYKPNSVPQICIGMPITSWSSQRKNYTARANVSPADLLLVRTFISSLPDVTARGENRFKLVLYLGIDEGDPLFDNELRFEAVRQEIIKAAGHVAITVKHPVVLPLLYGNNVFFWNHVLAQV